LKNSGTTHSNLTYINFCFRINWIQNSY
jgi:hypothetical protein